MGGIICLIPLCHHICEVKKAISSKKKYASHLPMLAQYVSVNPHLSRDALLDSCIFK
jgi:hypothetical protein